LGIEFGCGLMYLWASLPNSLSFWVRYSHMVPKPFYLFWICLESSLFIFFGFVWSPPACRLVCLALVW